jgi:hypothetical protein
MSSRKRRTQSDSSIEKQQPQPKKRLSKGNASKAAQTLRKGASSKERSEASKELARWKALKQKKANKEIVKKNVQFHEKMDNIDRKISNEGVVQTTQSGSGQIAFSFPAKYFGS